jgi:hypothetical protein
MSNLHRRPLDAQASPPCAISIPPIDPASRSSTIEIVRGRLDRARADELLSFWSRRGALDPAQAQQRLPEVVCILRRGGTVAGASSVYPADLEAIGGRRFWIYRSLLDAEVSDRGPAMIGATFDALDAEFDGSSRSPLGLCLLLADPAEWRRRPQAVWEEPPMIYAGYLADGRQVRVGYFQGALITGETQARG